jgi:hypothetical protein
MNRRLYRQISAIQKSLYKKTTEIHPSNEKPSFIIYFVTNLIHIQFTQLFCLLLVDLIY